jgi:4-hydroxy-tetrahydrodipicolinate synthase
MFQGSIVALATPMTAGGRIDFDALVKLVDYQLANGTCALVISGTTGEAATLTPDELGSLWGRVVAQVAGRVPVIAGTGSNSTARAIEYTRLAAAAGADAALVVTPYYNRPTQAGLVAHFLAIEAASALPLLLYNVPGRTAVDMQPETVARLAGQGGIVGIKEAVPEMARVRELVELCGPDFPVLSGDDATCAEAMLNGASGVVSVIANAAPAQMRQLCDLALAGNRPGAVEASRVLEPLFEALMIQSNPIPVKWALYKMGLIDSGIRLPLTPLEEQYRPQVEACLRRAGLLTH